MFEVKLHWPAPQQSSSSNPMEPSVRMGRFED